MRAYALTPEGFEENTQGERVVRLPERTLLLTLLLTIGPGCAPEVGSEAWCEKLDETPTNEDFLSRFVIRE